MTVEPAVCCGGVGSFHGGEDSRREKAVTITVDTNSCVDERRRLRAKVASSDRPADFIFALVEVFPGYCESIVWNGR